MEILLSKPGGKREGPFTLEQINAGLLQKQFKDSDYWAWYEGLDSWVPLHQVPGVVDGSKAGSKPDAAGNKQAAEPAEDLKAPDEDTQFISGPGAARTTSAGGVKPALASGMPLEKLERIFVFTDGEGPAAMQSSTTVAALEAIVGADLATIRERVPRDVFGRCNIPQKLAQENGVPASAWRAMSALRAELVQQARGGAHKVCVRVLEIDAKQQLAIFLFYRK